MGFRNETPEKEQPTLINTAGTYGRNDLELKVRPHNIMPIPQSSVINSKTPKSGRIPEKAAVITSDGFLNDLRIKKMKSEKENDGEKVTGRKGAKRQSVQSPKTERGGHVRTKKIL